MFRLRVDSVDVRVDEAALPIPQRQGHPTIVIVVLHRLPSIDDIYGHMSISTAACHDTPSAQLRNTIMTTEPEFSAAFCPLGCNTVELA